MITWSGGALPILSQWLSMVSGDYELGLEPANRFICGRHDKRENGALPVLKAFETERHTGRIAFNN